MTETAAVLRGRWVGLSARDLARQGLGGLRVYSGLDGVDVTDRQLAAGDSDNIGAGGPHNETLPPQLQLHGTASWSASASKGGTWPGSDQRTVATS